MKKMRQALAILLAGTMVAGLATGCGSKSDDKKAANDTPLVIACADMNEKFSEFFANAVPDQNVADMTAVPLLENNRQGEFVMKGIDGETSEYNGTDYTYTGIADCEMVQNDDGTVDYNFTLRDDVKFSDGEKLTADDAIFSYYVFCDPSYDGGMATGALPIEGLEDYKSGSEILYKLMLQNGADNTDNSIYTADQQKKFFETDLAKAGEAVAQGILDNLGTEDVAEAMTGWGYADAATGTPTLADFWNAIITNPAYEGDIDLAATTEQGNVSLGEALAAIDDSYISAVETGTSADYISGIVKNDEYSFTIKLTTVDATALQNLNIPVQPMHYYGDKDAYDYDNHKFGFPKGDLSIVRSKTTTPMGAGPYKFVKFENKIAYLEANENFFRGEPKTKNLQFKTTSEPDSVPAVIQGTVDISEPSISKDAVAQIKGENSNDELDGDKLSATLFDYNGYGYIGMNSHRVKVGEDGSTEQSKDLRKAIATVLAVYRDVAIDSYYGEAATVINYPISNTSWAAPQKSDSDYKVAFSTDVNGQPIYTEGMSEEDKEAAALQAALGYFEAAGYTVADGKVTAAPAGAALSYELMIGAAGSGDHPSFAVVTAASEALKSIGFELKINDLADSSQLWTGLDAGTVDIWCAAWSATLDPDMFQIYHSEGGDAGKYCIYSADLDQMVMDAKTNIDQKYRKAKYKECLDFIVDYAVEVPIYQRQECKLFSTERVNMDTVTKDQTSFYSFLKDQEICNLELN